MIHDLSSATPIVSVVMPVYNTEAYLTDSVDSILGQTFLDWELICVDDGSSDGSLDILRRYERADPRVRVITRPNTGVARARNDGMRVAAGRYIAAMDSDDVALPERLRRQVDYMESHPECVGLGAAVRIVGPDLMPIDDEYKPLDHETIDGQTLAGSRRRYSPARRDVPYGGTPSDRWVSRGIFHPRRHGSVFAVGRDRAPCESAGYLVVVSAAARKHQSHASRIAGPAWD